MIIRAFIILIVVVVGSAWARADISLDTFDNILEGMAAKPAVDSEIQRLGAIANSMAGDPEDMLIASVADAMTAEKAINGALDFVTNAYRPEPSYRRSSFYPNHKFYNDRNDGRGGLVPMAPAGYALPVRGIITSRYGFRPRFGRMHKGVDIGLQTGDTVVAALDGVVTRVDWEAKGYGHFVVIQHADGLETRYAHLSRALTTPGARVHAGDPIALGGNTGNSTGPHLHFETRQYGTAFDPTQMFDFTGGGRLMMPARNLADLDRDRLDGIYGAMEGAYNPGRNPYDMAQPQGALAGRSTYIVRAGDTLASVASRANISVLTLCRLNMLSSTDLLTPGRVLRLR